jgi:uncharacterized protein (DUF433 family)
MTRLELVHTPSVLSEEDGSLRLAGSRIPLDTIIREFLQGATAEQIKDSFPSLPLSSIYGAIAFYLEHPQVIEEYLREREKEATSVRMRIEEKPATAEFRERLRRRAQLS